MNEIVADWERKYELLKQDYLRASDLKHARMAKIVELEHELAAAQSALARAEQNIRAVTGLKRIAETERNRYKAEMADLRKENDAWRRIIRDCFNDAECLPACDSAGHDPDCPIADAANRINSLRAALGTIENETIERIIAVCRDNDCYRAITAIRGMKKEGA